MPGRRNILTSNWGDLVKVRMSFKEEENATVCSYDRRKPAGGEGPELCLQGVVGLALCMINKEGDC